MTTSSADQPVAPDYTAQSGEPMTSPERSSWIIARMNAARRKGCMHSRVTAHPTVPHLVLFESWKTRPAIEPEPFFHFEAVA